MSEIGKLMNFEEFRASCDASAGADLLVAAVQQQREHFQDAAAAEAVLRAGALGMKGWAEWPQVSLPVTR
jgi:hypothetical protein